MNYLDSMYYIKTKSEGKSKNSYPRYSSKSLSTVFSCLSPFEIEPNITLDGSGQADFSKESFKNQ